MELEVFPENARAVGLYVKFGFSVEGLKTRAVAAEKTARARDSLLMGLILR